MTESTLDRGPRFRHRVEAIVDAFSSMQEDLDKEKKASGRARGTNYARHAIDGGYVWRLAGDCGKVVAGDWRVESSGARR